MPHSRIWEMAMSRGHFVAIYTSRSVERSTVGSIADLWSSAFVPTTGEPLRFPPFPDLGGNYNDYARYEPAYDEQFSTMCRDCSRYGGHWPTVVLPSSANDKEAMRLLGEFNSIQGDAWAYLDEKFYIIPRQNLRKPKKNQHKFSTSMQPIGLSGGWAHFLGFFRSGDGVVVFLSASESDVEGLFDPIDAAHPVIRQADWLNQYGVIGMW